MALPHAPPLDIVDARPPGSGETVVTTPSRPCTLGTEHAVTDSSLLVTVFSQTP
jgi:hypothetical protein